MLIESVYSFYIMYDRCLLFKLVRTQNKTYQRGDTGGSCACVRGCRGACLLKTVYRYVCLYLCIYVLFVMYVLVICEPEKNFCLRLSLVQITKFEEFAV